MTRIPEIKIEPMAPAIIIAFVICTAMILGALGWAIWGPEPESDWTDEEIAQIRSGIQFPPLRVDETRLAAARADHYVVADLQLYADSVEELRALARRANLTQFPPHDPDNIIDHRELEHRLIFAADEVVPAAGVRGFMSVGEPIFERCNRGLRDLLSAIRRNELPLTQAVEDPPADRFYLYRENCGNLLPILIERHLVGADGQWQRTYSQVIVDLIQRYRWADLLHTRYPTHQQMAPYELELFFRWRIEDPDAFTVVERRRHLQSARSVLDETEYDYALARARLDAANGDLERAVARFADLVEEDPHNQVYSSIHAELSRQWARAPRR